MKTIIAGSRGISDYSIVYNAIDASGLYGLITEVVSGAARGVDRLGEFWAKEHRVRVKKFPVEKEEWENIDAPGARVKTRPDGSKYNANAGHDRNQRMADYADALIAIWDGKSPGTRDMIRRAEARGLKCYVMKG